MPYLYKDHLFGGYYSSNFEQDYEQLYCDQCGDSDTFIGEYETDAEMQALVEKEEEMYDYEEEEE